MGIGAGLDINLFDETQRKLLHILADGEAHKRAELIDVLPGRNKSFKELSNQFSAMRKLMKPLGQNIICEWHQRTYKYRHVLLLNGPSCD